MSWLRETGLARIVFSLHAAEPALHDQVTLTPGSFMGTLGTMKEAVNAGLNVELHFVPMRLNYRQLPRLVDLARAHALSRVSILRFVPHGGGKQAPGLALSHEQNLELRDMVRVLRRSFNIRLGSPYSFLLTGETSQCLAGLDRLSISPDLRVYPCDAFKRIEATGIVVSVRSSAPHLGLRDPACGRARAG